MLIFTVHFELLTRVTKVQFTKKGGKMSSNGFAELLIF